MPLPDSWPHRKRLPTPHIRRNRSTHGTQGTTHRRRQYRVLLTTAGAPTATAAPPQAAAACGEGSYRAEAVLNGSTWTARRGSSTLYTSGDMRAAVQAAVNSLTSGRTSKERVVVRGSGSLSAGSRITLPSHTVLDVCGTINVTGSGTGDQAPVYSRGTRDVEVQNLKVTGSPLYGIFLRNVQNLVLGQIDVRLSRGLGVRIDNRGDTSQWTRNVRIDVHVSGASSHAVETYGVDGVTFGTVTARNVGESGLRPHQTINVASRPAARSASPRAPSSRTARTSPSRT